MFKLRHIIRMKDYSSLSTNIVRPGNVHQCYTVFWMHPETMDPNAWHTNQPTAKLYPRGV